MGAIRLDQGLLDKMAKTKSNADFLAAMQKMG